jgi:hypothetical protein
MSRSLGRRRFLGTLGLGAALLPFVPMFDVHAEPDKTPRRLVFFFSSNGTIHESWLPSMTDGMLSLSPILSPLEKHKSRLLVVDGLAHTVILEKGDRSGHSAGMNTVLTGRKAKSIDTANPLRSLGTGISIDQYLAQRLALDTKLRTLECGVQVQPYSTDSASLSYSGPEAPISAENSPYRVFDRLFKGFTDPRATPSPETEQSLRDRKAVLEAVATELDAVKRRLPEDDRIKMEAHLDAVRSIEHGLTTGLGAGAAQVCQKPDLGKAIDLWRNDNIPALGKLQMDLLVMALACDLTRIGTIQYGRAGAAHRFNWLGPEFATDPALAVTDQAKGFHALAHKESDPSSRAKLVKIHSWYAGQLAYLLDRLASIPEAGGTMLDNTLVVWINELGTGGTHSHQNTPWVLAGNVRKFFKTGQLATFQNEPHNRMLITLLHAMGVDEQAFGDPDFCKGGALTGITT